MGFRLRILLISLESWVPLKGAVERKRNGFPRQSQS